MSFSRSGNLLVLSVIIFGFIFLMGLLFSRNKPLWLDEHYSLTSSICPVSYKNMLLGHMDSETNNSPLFYTLQKILCDLVKYDPACLKAQQRLKVRIHVMSYDELAHRPLIDRLLAKLRFWEPPYTLRVKSYNPLKSRYFEGIAYQSEIFWTDQFSNMYLRLVSLFFMALAPAILFYYFSYREKSYDWGVYAVLLCMTNWIFWWYGLEARPYIHFFTLTVFEALVLWDMIRFGANRDRIWLAMSIVHILLALTFTTSAFQILAVGLCLGFSSKEALTVKR
ncbi:MAG: hypothetical protein WCH62_07110, partial [Candidatus Omnitrophota bacterium]